MKKRVYIQKSIFFTSGFTNIEIKDKNIDFISRLCIKAIASLFEGECVSKPYAPIFFGTAFSSLKSLSEFNSVFESSGALAVNPSLFPNTVLNAPACRASIYFHITEPIYNISNGKLSGLDALGYAYMNIHNSEIPNAIVCIAEENSEIACKAEGQRITDFCGAFYLSGEPGGSEIIQYEKCFADTKNQTDDITARAGGMDTIRRINTFLSDQCSEKERVFTSYEAPYASGITIQKLKGQDWV